MRFLRAPAAAYACAEAAFWCYSSAQTRSNNAYRPGYANAPGCEPFTPERRRREMDRIFSTEFGLERERPAGASTPARTPERGRAWLSGWFFDTPFESIPREEVRTFHEVRVTLGNPNPNPNPNPNQVRTFLSWAYFNREGPAALTPAERDEVDATLTRLEHLAERPLSSASPPPPEGPLPERTGELVRSASFARLVCIGFHASLVCSELPLEGPVRRCAASCPTDAFCATGASCAYLRLLTLT